MDELLKDLETKWQQVSGYDDIEASPWTPGRAIADKCPAGDRARIYVISGPTAAEHGWEPPEDAA